jgi:hypothetical protein
MRQLEYATAQDDFFDFCLWKYKPLAPFAGKLRSANLLLNSFDVAGADNRAIELVDLIRQEIGPSKTVWGVKQIQDDMSWEFYFYDYRRIRRERSVARLLEIMNPILPCEILVNENYPYFMFSIDIDTDLLSGNRALEQLHLYIGNEGSAVSSGICYLISKGDKRLENLYFFFDARKQMDDIIYKTLCSAYLDSTVLDIAHIIWPELRECRIIVVANKQNRDAVYFSGINVHQLLFFLKKMKYPAELVSFVEENREKLDHLQFDVGFDYRMEGNALNILKSGYYGIF